MSALLVALSERMQLRGHRMRSVFSNLSGQTAGEGVARSQRLSAGDRAFGPSEHQDNKQQIILLPDILNLVGGSESGQPTIPIALAKVSIVSSPVAV
jgi:hypothetical protein